MIINPQTAVDEGWITFPDKPMTRNQLQPNGIDLRIKRGIKLPIHKPFKLFLDETVHVSWYMPEGSLYKGTETILFERMQPYLIDTYEFVRIPVGVAAYIIGRSSLNRNGIFARSSLYDSGFADYAGFSMYPFVPMEVHVGARMAQIIFMKAESNFLYAGQYQSDNYSGTAGKP